MTASGIREGPSLTVLVGTCNRCALLQRCVEALRSHPADFLKIVISDAGSTDGSRDYLALQHDVTVILETGKRGQAHALNEAARSVRTEFLCWLSDDNIVRAGILREAVDCMRQDSRLGMLGLKVQDKTGPYADIPFIGTVAENGVLNCNQGLIRKQTFDAVNGFDEDLRDYLIDRDLTTKVLLAGWDVALTKSVAIDHYRDHETDSWITSASRKKKIQTNQQIYRDRYAALSRLGVARLVQTIRQKQKLRRRAMRTLIAGWWKHDPDSVCQTLHAYALFSRAAFVGNEEANPPGAAYCLRQSMPDAAAQLARESASDQAQSPSAATLVARIRKNLLRVHCTGTDALSILYIRDRSWPRAIRNYLHIRISAMLHKDPEHLSQTISRLTGLDAAASLQLAGDILDRKKNRQILCSALEKQAALRCRTLPA